MDIGSIINYFTDPVLRAPMIGSILMCVAAALVGVIVFLRKSALLGEALSHAAYPGVVLGVVIVGLLTGDQTAGEEIELTLIAGAFITALSGMGVLRVLEKKGKVKHDAALCFVLSFFFGIGITIASHIQFSFPNLYRQVQIYFYGQAATMTDQHIYIYLIFVIVLMTSLFLFRKEIKTLLFNPEYAQVAGLNVPLLDMVLFLLITVAVVIGIRSVGVVLMSAMLIAPAAAARQCTHSLRKMFALSALFGVISAFLGTILANESTLKLLELYPGVRRAMPTGPLIVLVASLICLLALFFAPDKGIFVRFLRILRFRANCSKENLLKALWRESPQKLAPLSALLCINRVHLLWLLFRLRRQGWINRGAAGYYLTKDGDVRASKIIRLHRLWELYLADYVGVGATRVHSSAEEMEHILTPELEKQLTELLKDPKQDPHRQPIPPRVVL